MAELSIETLRLVDFVQKQHDVTRYCDDRTWWQLRCGQLECTGIYTQVATLTSDQYNHVSIAIFNFRLRQSRHRMHSSSDAIYGRTGRSECALPLPLG